MTLLIPHVSVSFFFRDKFCFAHGNFRKSNRDFGKVPVKIFEKSARDKFQNKKIFLWKRTLLATNYAEKDSSVFQGS